jgi:hypothetical protein
MSDELDFEHWSHLGQERAIALDRTNAADLKRSSVTEREPTALGRGDFMGRAVIDISFSPTSTTVPQPLPLT